MTVLKESDPLTLARTHTVFTGDTGVLELPQSPWPPFPGAGRTPGKACTVCGHGAHSCAPVSAVLAEGPVACTCLTTRPGL